MNLKFLISFLIFSAVSTGWLLFHNYRGLDDYASVYISEFFILEFVTNIKIKYQIYVEAALMIFLFYFVSQAIIQVYYGV